MPTGDGPPPPTSGPGPSTDPLVVDPATLASAAEGFAARHEHPSALGLDRALLSGTALGHPTLAHALRDLTDLWDHCLNALADRGTAIEQHLRQAAAGYQQTDTAATDALTSSGFPHESTRAG